MAKDPSTDRPAITTPTGADRDWQAKIARAKAARDDGKTMRAGKPLSFRAAVGRSR